MALPHAGYAGVAIVSEELVNFALNTYLANFLDNQHVQWQWTSPVTINGSTLSTTFSADATLISLAASLKASNNQDVSFLGRFYAKAFLDLSLVPSFNAAHVAFTIPKQVGPIETGLDAEALIEFSLTAPLVAVSSGQGYQFGVDTQNAWITSITAHLISTTLPYEYLSALQDGLQAPLTQQVLNTFLHNLPPSTLRASVITTPDSFSYDVVRPQPPYPRWFSVSAPTPQFTWKQLDGAVIAAIDMPGFTSGSWQDLWDFREDELRAFGGSIYFPDLGSAINMQFLQDFVQRQIIPNMRDGFLTNTFPPIYLHQINRFEVKSISTPEEASRPGVEVECFVTVYTDESALFDLNGTSGVDVTVTIRGFLSLRNGRLGFTVTGTDYDVHLPLAVEITLFALALVLPPASFLVPFLAQDLIRNAEADAGVNLQILGERNSFDLSQDILLPDTVAPAFHLRPLIWDNEVFGENPTAKYGVLLANFERWYVASLQFYAQTGPNPVSVPLNADRFYISQPWVLPYIVFCYFTNYQGLFQPHDPTLRVRWQTFANDNLIAMGSKDVALRDALSTSMQVSIYRFMNPNKPDQDIRISCRLYRQLAGQTEEIMNTTVHVLSYDPSDDSVKPYVQWSHYVKYFDGYRPVTRRRVSKIHKAPGKGGCRFSGQFLLPRMHNKGKFYSIRRFTGLPFDFAEIEKHRDLVCPYCFFGGPDKHYHPQYNEIADYTGVVSRRWEGKSITWQGAGG